MRIRAVSDHAMRIPDVSTALYENTSRSLTSIKRTVFPIALTENDKNSSGDEIANVLVNDDIAHT